MLRGGAWPLPERVSAVGTMESLSKSRIVDLPPKRHFAGGTSAGYRKPAAAIEKV